MHVCERCLKMPVIIYSCKIYISYYKHVSLLLCNGYNRNTTLLRKQKPREPDKLKTLKFVI